MKETNVYGLVISSIEITLCGLLFAVNPNYFFNPVTGILRSFSPLTEDAIVPPFVQLDDLTYYSMTSFGIGCVCIGSMNLLAGDDHLLKKEILQAKLWLAVLSAYVSMRAAFLYDLMGINKVAVGFLGGMSAANFLWAFSETMKASNVPDKIPRTQPTALQFMTLWLDCIFCALWAVTLFWNPRNLEPGNPMSVLKATPMEDNTFMELHLYTIRLESAPMVAFTLCMLKLIITDRSVEAIRANNKLALVCFALYTINWFRMYLWCEYAHELAMTMNILINVGFGAFIFKFGPTPEISKKEEVKSEAPDLVAETKNKAI